MVNKKWFLPCWLFLVIFAGTSMPVSAQKQEVVSIDRRLSIAESCLENKLDAQCLSNLNTLLKEDTALFTANQAYFAGKLFSQMPKKGIEALSFYQLAIQKGVASQVYFSKGEEPAPQIAYYEAGVIAYHNELFKEAETYFSQFVNLILQNPKVKEKQQAIKYIVYCNNAIRYENTNVFNSEREATVYKGGGKHPYLPVFYRSPNVFLKEVTSYAPVTMDEKSTLFYLLEKDQYDKKADTNINMDQIFKIRREKIKLTDLCFNQDSTAVIFSSNKKGGYGGYDLYMAEKKANGKWGKPMNLGHTINTSHDECFPSLASDNVTLFFSSNNLKSMGGFDVFYSTRDENGQWSVYENLGSPINTLSDEIKFLILPSSNLAYYYSSYNRQGQSDGVYRVVFK